MRTVLPQGSSLSPWHVLFLGLLAAMGTARDVAADEAGKAKAGTAVGTVASGPASVLERVDEAANRWQPLKPNDPVPSGHLLIAFSQGIIDSKNRDVRLTMFGSLVDESMVEETAVVLNDNPKVDLDVTLDRGQIHLANRKQSGAAHVRVRFLEKQAWDISLDEPGSEVALQIYGRHLPGVGATIRDGAAKGGPYVQMALVVVKGEAHLDHGDFHYAMTAPPGPAYFHWDNVQGDDPRPTKLDALPDWAKGVNVFSTFDKQQRALVFLIRNRVLLAGVEQALAEALESSNPSYRRMAIHAAAALDYLGRIGEALVHPTYPDLRDNAVVALRHWRGRGPGQDEKLYRFLVEQKKFTPVHAKSIIQLLQSFDEMNLERPETYEMLIAYLDHPNMGAREMAAWHLYRLVPAGRKIAYDPAGSAEERQKAVAQWKELIPEGKLPPRSTKAGNKKNPD